MSAAVLLHPSRIGRTLAHQHAAADIRVRGYSVLYRRGETNHCPGCSRSHWHVGRFSAECAFCGTALPFAAASTGKDS
jgi:hypothetical protein